MDDADRKECLIVTVGILYSYICSLTQTELDDDWINRSRVMDPIYFGKVDEQYLMDSKNLCSKCCARYMAYKKRSASWDG